MNRELGVISEIEPVVIDPAMKAIFAKLRQIGATSLPVLLLGETGAGKEVIADATHAASKRAGGPLIKINCAGLTESVVESELFGHERGAFTGALQAHDGLIAGAHAGTLFLDEIGELPARTQAKLLRVLETGEIARVGSSKTRRVDVRFIAATHRNLTEQVEQGSFRQDLYFRINAICIQIPPLRERRFEIQPLAEMFLQRYVRRHGSTPVTLDDSAIALLLQHAWPGNVRELRNVIETAVAMCSGPRIHAIDLPLDTGPALGVRVSSLDARRPPPAFDEPACNPSDMRTSLKDFERAQIVAALARTRGNQTQAAKLLGVSRRTLSNKLNVHGFERPRRPVSEPPGEQAQYVEALRLDRTGSWRGVRNGV